ISDMRFVFRVKNRGGEETEIARGPRNIETAREGERLAGVDRFGARELFEIALDQIGDAQENARSIRRRRARPIRECFFRRGYGQLDIARVAVRNLRVGLPRRRFDIVEIFSADWRNELAIDEVFDLESLGAHGFEERLNPKSSRSIKSSDQNRTVRDVSTAL